MGFFLMVSLAIIGIVLIIFGGTHIKNKGSNLWNLVSIAIGVASILLAIGLGLPK